MSGPLVSITVTRRVGREAVDEELQVESFADLYRICVASGTSELVRITLRGSEGEVSLRFASVIRK